MKLALLALTLGLVVHAFAQEATPPPKKDPFAGFGKTALDPKTPGKPAPGLPQKPVVPMTPPPFVPAPSSVPSSAKSEAKGGGLKLTAHWDSPTGLARGGPQQQRKELKALLTGFAEPGADFDPHPEKHIYRRVTYLLPMAEAREVLGIARNLRSGGKSPVVGFPDGGLTFEAFTANAERPYETRVLQDIAYQVVAVEFVALEAGQLPKPPDPLPVSPEKRHVRSGKTYDFVPEGITAVNRSFSQVSWDLGDYVLISTRGGPKAADLYIPKPMVGFILHCLNRPSGQ